MRQIWITRKGPPEVLEVREAPDPAPGAGQVRVRVRAAGVNFADLMARVGLYPDAPPLPCVVGYEVAGELDAVGPGVARLRPGDRVFAMPRFGGYSDTVVLPEGQAFALPSRMSFEEGAAMPVVYLTAYTCLLFTGHLRPGATVLVHSAAGGVGLAALQIAKTRACRVLGVASAGKHDFLRARGVDHPLDAAGDWVSAARAIVGEAGVDVVLDPVGGRSWTDGFGLLAPCGRLVCYGLSAAAGGTRRNLLRAASAVLAVKKWSPMQLMDQNKSVTGVNMGHLFDRLDLLTPQFEELVALYERGAIAPHVDKTFRFAEAPAAHQYIHDRRATGKVVLVP